jgi:hypothetical protein
VSVRGSMPRPTTRTCPHRRHTDQLLISRTELRAHTELESVFFALLDPVPTSSCVDLCNYHVSTHASAIPARLRNGSMPCDGAWPTDRSMRSKDGWTSASHLECRGRPDSRDRWALLQVPRPDPRRALRFDLLRNLRSTTGPVRQ